MDLFRERGVKLLHIGKYSANASLHILDVHLSTVSGTENTLKYDFAKRAAQQHIVDILLAMAITD